MSWLRGSEIILRVSFFFCHACVLYQRKQISLDMVRESTNCCDDSQGSDHQGVDAPRKLWTEFSFSYF